MNSEHDIAVENAENTVIKLAARAVNALYALAIIAVVASFGVGAFVTTTNERLAALQNDVSQIRVELIQDFRRRMVSIEKSIAVGMLPRTDKKLRELAERITRLERNDRGGS